MPGRVTSRNPNKKKASAGRVQPRRVCHGGSSRAGGQSARAVAADAPKIHGGRWRRAQKSAPALADLFVCHALPQSAMPSEIRTWMLLAGPEGLPEEGLSSLSTSRPLERPAF